MRPPRTIPVREELRLMALRRLFFCCASIVVLMSGCFLDGTMYAPGYSESAFEAIKIGDSREKVLSSLGKPLDTVGYRFYYYYNDRDLIFLVDTEMQSVSFASFCNPSDEAMNKYGSGLTPAQLEKLLGPPEKSIGVDLGQSDNPALYSLVYSRPGNGLSWKFRKLDINKNSGKVVKKISKTLND